MRAVTRCNLRGCKHTFFDWRIHIHINTHALCTQLCRCVLSLGHQGHHCSSFHNVPAANNRFFFQQSGRMAGRWKSPIKFWPGGSPLQNWPFKTKEIILHIVPYQCFSKLISFSLLFQNTFVSTRPWEPSTSFSPASAGHARWKRPNAFPLAWVTLEEVSPVLLPQPL